MKKLLSLLIFASTFIQAQYTVKGTMTPPEKSDWVALYKINGSKQKFIKKSTIKFSEVSVKNVNQSIGNFEFKLNEDAQKGSYRITYGQTGGSFVDFFFNNEDIEMIFNPKYPEESIIFTKSSENKVFLEYIDAQSLLQHKIDSLQEKYFVKQDKNIKNLYREQVSKLKEVQKIYENKSNGMYVHDFVKNSKIKNTKSPFLDKNKYKTYTVKHFFDNVNFKNKQIAYSPFIVSKISDYIFYLKTGDTQELQQKLYVESISEVMKLIKKDKLRSMITEYLITNFTNKRNSEIVDWMFEEYYDKLPEEFKTKSFKKKKLDALKVSVGRVAPDFSWKEDGETLSLSKLKDGSKYLLIFWSTQCSHCAVEIPEVHKFMKDKTDVSVVAFAIEENDIDFDSWAKNKLYNFHNAIGTNPGGNKFENKTVQDYLIDATPTYFVLDKNKKIIYVPNEAKDVKDYFNK